MTADGVDLAANEVAVRNQWMAKHAPELLAWVNQCGEGSEWLARARTLFAVPELYAVKDAANASALAPSRRSAQRSSPDTKARCVYALQLYAAMRSTS